MSARRTRNSPWRNDQAFASLAATPEGGMDVIGADTGSASRARGDRKDGKWVGRKLHFFPRASPEKATAQVMLAQRAAISEEIYCLYTMS